MTFIFIPIIIVILLLLNIFYIYKVPKDNQWIVERFNKFYTVWDSGIHFTIPYIYKIVNKVKIDSQIYTFNRITIITKDEIQFTPNIIVDFNIYDSVKFTYQEKRPMLALEKDIAKIIRYATSYISSEYLTNNIHSIENQILDELNTFTNYYGISVNYLVLELKETL